MTTMGERLREARKNAGFRSARSAAVHHGWAASTYGAHENGQNNFDPDIAVIYGKAFAVNPGWLLTNRGNMGADSRPQVVENDGVRIVGIAGAGPMGEIEFIDGENDLGFAPVPPSWNINTIALIVRGSSMRPMAYDGWYVYYDEKRSAISEDMLGEPCVVGTKDSRVLIKIPIATRDKSLFNLESVNPNYDTMYDVEVEWAALVTAFIPRRAARKVSMPVEGDAGV